MEHNDTEYLALFSKHYVNTLVVKKIINFLQHEHLQDSIVVLPEMFNTGYSLQYSDIVSSSMEITKQFMSDFSKKNKCLIVGSIPFKEGNKLYNRLLAYSNGKKIAQYDKRHLFSNANEDKLYSPGKEIIVFNYQNIKIKPAICYDLRFPVWLRNKENYDLLIIVANWPAKRLHVWETLLKARSIENQCFVVGVNRVGTDKNGFVYNGNSMFIDPKGKIIAKCTDKEEVCKVEFDKKELEEFRKKFDTLKDADNFNILL